MERAMNYQIEHGDALILLREMLESGQRVDHVITDPPYNISKANNFTTMSSAKRQGVDFGEWDKGFDLCGWIPLAAELMREGGSMIVFNSYRHLTPIVEAMEQAGLVVKDVLKWIKSNPMPRNIKRRYVQDTEFAIWAVKPKKPWVFNVPDDAPYLRAEFHTAVVAGKERLGHPTQKSLALMKAIIEIHSNAGETILDPFMGTGTTGEAALELGRKFVGMELEKKYYQIAERRLRDASKRSAK